MTHQSLRHTDPAQSQNEMMEIKGLDYNTQREPLVMPEYGREIQKMVDYAVTLPTKEQRLACAKSIVRMMVTKVPHLRENTNYAQTLWDHLYLMSHKQLDIDWPQDVTGAEKMFSKPNPVPLPSKRGRVKLRHYGRLVEDTLAHLKEMPAGEERDALARLVAYQMKRDLANWGHGSMDANRVAADIALFTDGRVQIDLNTLKPERLIPQRTQMTAADNSYFRRRRRK